MALACCVYRMSTRLPSDDPDIDVSALRLEVGAVSAATTPMRSMQTRQRRREAEAAALHGPNTQSGTAPARVQHPFLNLWCPVGSYLHVEEVYLDYPIRYDRCSMSCLHARGISDLPMGNGPGLQQQEHSCTNRAPSRHPQSQDRRGG